MSGSMESVYNLIFLLMQRVTLYLEYKISTRCSAEFQTLNLLGCLPQINCYTQFKPCCLCLNLSVVIKDTSN